MVVSYGVLMTVRLTSFVLLGGGALEEYGIYHIEHAVTYYMHCLMIFLHLMKHVSYLYGL